jgi:peptidoglycan/xylan/chitin deacetylase (PgdA/CDA1 family)
VAVHSDTHPWWFSIAPPHRVRREVREGAACLERLAGRPPRHFRPPVGHKSIFLRDALPEAGLSLVTWSARAFDTLGRGAAGIERAILRRAEPGAIVLLHEGVRRRPGKPSGTVAALPGIVAGLRARGLEPVSLEGLRAAPDRTGSSSPPA